MKKIFIPSMLIALAMICSCQKQDSAAEQQLAQRKTELDAREIALDEREKALHERERSLAEREKAIAKIRTTPPGVQGQTPDPSQMNAERDRRIQQLPPEFRALIPDRSQVTAGDPAKQERPAPRQLGPEDLQRQWQRKLDKAKMSGKAVFPAAEAGSPTPSPAVSPATEAISTTPSPTPE
jgi:septal ring factor EnvC (AmiA/AmiB activator)